MANTVVIGMQWGDEGKGKVVDLLCPAFEVVVRYQGGHNAGHTVKFGDQHFALHLIPSGILRPETMCVLGNGLVVSPDALFEELDTLHEAGVESDGRLFISSRAHVLLPWYALLDQARERARGDQKIGTTSRGIGPAYEAKAARAGVRMADLFSSVLKDRLEWLGQRVSHELAGRGETVDVAAMERQCAEWAEKLKPFVRDTETLLAEAIADGRSILFEGAQGTFLDIDHGTYPFVTSSTSSAGGAAVGSGVGPTRLDGVVGVLKAYTTRVGEGPFITELEDENGRYLQARGNEVGTTTGRPRRCGWLDLVAARHACILNGIDSIALTKLDVLDGFEKIELCVAYRLDGEVLDRPPADTTAMSRAEPVYETVPGWEGKTAGILSVDDLPEGARAYIARVEEYLGTPVGLISTGPRREETILCPEPRLSSLTDNRLVAVPGESSVG